MKSTREKILEVGLSLFSKKGYIGTTTKDIAQCAGVAELTIFRHFSSKEKLFAEVINKYSFLPTLKDLLQDIKDKDYREALSLIAENFLIRLSERRELIRIMHSEIHLYPSKVKDIYHNVIDEMLRTLASYFRELQVKKYLRDFNPEIAAKAFLGMFFSYFNAQQFLLRKKRASDNHNLIINEFVDIFIKGTVR